MTVVLTLGEKLWRHVAWCADLSRIESWSTLTSKSTDEAKVNDLKIVIIVQQNILRLQISVGEAKSMQVIDALQQLLDVVPADTRTKVAFLNDIGEHLSAADKLQDNISNFDLGTIFLVPDGALFESKVAHEVLMLKLLYNCDFLLKLLHKLLSLWEHACVDNLDRVCSIGIHAFLNFGAKAATKCSSEGIIVNSRNHAFLCYSKFFLLINNENWKYIKLKIE